MRSPSVTLRTLCTICPRADCIRLSVCLSLFLFFPVFCTWCTIHIINKIKKYIIHQMWFGGRAPPGPAGRLSLECSPDPLAALKLLLRRSILGACGALPHAFGVRRQSVSVLLIFPFEHWCTVLYKYNTELKLPSLLINQPNYLVNQSYQIDENQNKS